MDPADAVYLLPDTIQTARESKLLVLKPTYQSFINAIQVSIQSSDTSITGKVTAAYRAGVNSVHETNKYKSQTQCPMLQK